MWELFPPRMRKTVFTAADEAAARGHAETGPEHLLLAICGDRESAAGFVLEHAGLDLRKLRMDVEAVAARGKHRPPRAERLSAAAMHVLDVAVAEGRRLAHAHVGTEHVLLALAMGRGGAASDVLARHGLTAAAVHAGLIAWQKRGMPRVRPAPSPRGRSLGARLGAPVRRAAAGVVKYPVLAYRIVGHKSLAHPRFITNPYPLYRWLREHAPVRRDPVLPVWVVTRYADVATVLKDPRFRRDPFTLDDMPPPMAEQLDKKVPNRTGYRINESTDLMMLLSDPPRHTKLRGAFARLFTPKALKPRPVRVRQIAEKLLDTVAAAGGGDLIRDFAAPLPTIVIAEILGFPPEDHPRLKGWSDDLAALLGPGFSGEQVTRGGRSLSELRNYTINLLKGPTPPPPDTLLSMMVPGKPSPLKEAGLNVREAFANLVLLLAAGHETTTNLIGNGVLALTRHPDQLALLQKDPLLVGGAVEELLRYDSPVQWTNRVAACDVELAGQRIGRGEMVLASLGSANRDPAQFGHPDRLDIGRAENRHLAFGGGIHFCLGAMLARMEAEIALRALIVRFPHLRVTKRWLKWQKGLVFRGVKALPVSVGKC